MEAHKLTVSEASRLVSDGALPPTELLESLLERIDALEPRLEAWVTVDREGARAAAERLSREAEEGRIRGPSTGYPSALRTSTTQLASGRRACARGTCVWAHALRISRVLDT